MNTLLTFKAALERQKRDLRESLSRLQNLREYSFEGAKYLFPSKTYPHAEDIFHILNPLYIYEIPQFEKFACHDYILVRDGFFPLADFFHRFSRPGGIETTLLVHERLRFIIPETWANNVLTYNIQKKFDGEEIRKTPQSFYLCAFTCDSDARYQTFFQKVLHLKETYGKNLDKMNLKLGILLREEPYYKVHKEVLHESFPLIKATYAQLGLNRECSTWADIITGKDYHKSCYYYITDEYFSHAYSYIDHFFLSRRCTPFDDRFDSQEKGEMVFEISPHYNIHVNEFCYQPNGVWQEINKMVNSLQVGERLSHSEFFPYSWKMAEEYLFHKSAATTRTPNRPVEGKVTTVPLDASPLLRLSGGGDVGEASMQ